MMDQITRNMKTKGVSEQRAVQAWELMTNGWTETEFERRLNQVKIQDKYPEIKEIVADAAEPPVSYSASETKALSPRPNPPRFFTLGTLDHLFCKVHICFCTLILRCIGNYRFSKRRSFRDFNRTGDQRLKRLITKVRLNLLNNLIR